MSSRPFRRLVAHIGRCLLCLITPIPSHRSSSAPFPMPGQSDALRRVLLTDSFPTHS